VNGTVPVPVAGEPREELAPAAEFEPADDEEPDDPVDDDDFELPDWLCCNAAWMAAVRAVLTRLNAVWFAMLARPCA